ncbi:UDP-N-acetylmuramoylalanyl-D-glutamate--2,6-diaminopimelate ligase [Virgibacillus profundi]|uniref:UDP-N-acetylmuramoyl-tripeptide--D-alanyl-D-alanine ligase n=1 Tax=Virgibacillus profundi TaxID=2024555 RepID=A0A2A2IFQ1_9BACI|nr:UDP-N-acetylmuramoyl-tripeptide--D-alanyl-D-alanine ligase [Virgibacillus profundi]PAV29913.1 UDP-N-acetylmuramoylalanyl-D-glutamate--2,6-diaminopimelate ligase [Virgibacillus profundi]PXY54085.1 UDP-N-acetylmuramoyl-tripeptide--D-alanyl-D-alanine ligase [Virgibacillus profundi]
MLFTTNWLSRLFTEFSGSAAEEIVIDEVITDSRAESAKSLFIPIIGDNFDGHDYVKQAINNGAAAVLWDKGIELPEFMPTDFPVFFVDDTIAALQKTASHYRAEINPIVIGITGSNGKTTTKDLVAAVVQSTYRAHYTDGNFNNHIGLPLTILSMKRDTEVLILEMGMSDFGEIDLLSKIAKPDYAIITNIGESHIEYLGSRKGISSAKLEIMNSLKDDGYVIIDGDEDLLKHIHKQKNVITCGFTIHNDVLIKNVDIKLNHTTFELADGSEYSVPLLGKHHALNAAYAITLGKQLGIDQEKCQKALQSLKLTSMRFEMIKGPNDVSIINDAYNASPTSMKAAIEVVKQMEGFTDKVLILGDVLELGKYSEELHRSVAEVIDIPINTVLTYGKDAENISTAVKKNKSYIHCNHFTSKEELIDALQDHLNKDSLLLFKASRGLKFELLIEEIIHTS